MDDVIRYCSLHSLNFDDGRQRTVRELVNRRGAKKNMTTVTGTFLQAVLQSTLDPLLIIDDHGIIQMASDSLERVFGWPPIELMGKNISILMPEPHHSSHDRYLADYRRTGITNILGNTRELEAIRKDGTQFPCEITVWKVDVPGQGSSLFTGIIRDITTRKQAEDAVRQSEQRLRRLAQEMPVMLQAFDASGNILVWNHECERVTGFPSEMIVGNRFAMDLLYPDIQYQRKMLEEWIERGNDYRDWEWQVACRDGSAKTIAWSSIAQRVPIRGWAAWSVGVDVSERKRAVAELEKSKENAEAASLAKSQFLANMSHEIRTPMTAILGFADVLLQDEEIRNTSDGPIENVETIKRNAEHLLEVINGILDQSKIDAGKVDIESTRCSAVQILADVVSLMRIRAQKKGLSLGIAYDGPIPATIETDPTRLRQILINLVGNAIKFTEKGSVELKVRTLLESHPRPQLEIAVKDTGMGMAADQTAIVFEPFAQADDSMTRRFGGTGLGLSISRGLAQLLGGDIRVESEQNRGSTFTVTVSAGVLNGIEMLESPSEAMTVRLDSPVKKSSAANLQDCRVLLAEDGPDNQRLITFLLRKAGAHVDVAENGQLAVERVYEAESRNESFDVILMDMQMPVLDGYEATKRLRMSGYSKPIIAVTAHAMSGDRQKCLEAGCDDYITKPVDRFQLIERVAEFANSTGSPANRAMVRTQ